LTVAFNVSREKTTQDLVAALSKMYEKPSASNKIFFMKKLFNLKMTDSGRVAEHLNEFNTLRASWNLLRSISMTKSRRWFYCPIYQRAEMVS